LPTLTFPLRVIAGIFLAEFLRGAPRPSPVDIFVFSFRLSPPVRRPYEIRILDNSVKKHHDANERASGTISND